VSGEDSPKAPNYITREGARKLQEELADLRTRQRPKIVQEVADAAAQGDRSENAEYIYGKRKLREIDRRMHWLTRRLERASVVEPRAPDGPAARDGERVFFGAYVEVEDEDGKRSTYRIVGEDEIDLGRGHISWRSPLGRVLLKRRTGDAVLFRRPSGEVELTIMSVRY
jgi:transcription elongation factor GreB